MGTRDRSQRQKEIVTPGVVLLRSIVVLVLLIGLSIVGTRIVYVYFGIRGMNVVCHIFGAVTGLWAAYVVRCYFVYRDG